MSVKMEGRQEEDRSGGTILANQGADTRATETDRELIFVSVRIGAVSILK
jgi:hypothetical protein